MPSLANNKLTASSKKSTARSCKSRPRDAFTVDRRLPTAHHYFVTVWPSLLILIPVSIPMATDLLTVLRLSKRKQETFTRVNLSLLVSCHYCNPRDFISAKTGLVSCMKGAVTYKDRSGPVLFNHVSNDVLWSNVWNLQRLVWLSVHMRGINRKKSGAQDGTVCFLCKWYSAWYRYRYICNIHVPGVWLCMVVCGHAPFIVWPPW